MRQYFVAMYSRKGSGRENAPSWQDVAEMRAESANFGKICFLCILKGVKNAVREYISRISCPEGPLFPSGALKSCTMGKFCHSFVIPPSARRGWRTTSVVILGYRSVAVPFTWRRKRCGRPSRGANVAARSLCGNARAATKATGRGRPLRTRRRLRGR